jgi:ABC-2 type transport system ATP-binding protein
MRARLAIAAALLRPRDLMILDEPTNGLDPQGTREVRALLADLAAHGTTVVLSTHLLSEVEQICTHVGVMHVGRLVAQGGLDELRAGAAPRIEIRTARPADASAELERLGLTEVIAGADTVTALLGGVEPEAVAPALVRADVPIRGLRVLAADLEELFVSLTGAGFDVSG